MIEPLFHYIKETARVNDRAMVTVLLPHIIPHYWWQEILHNQTAIQIELALRGTPLVVVTSVSTALQE